MATDSSNPKDGSASPRSGKVGITVLADEEVRRGLEQRALRNVRNLVDKLEDEQRKDDDLQNFVAFSRDSDSDCPHAVHESGRPRKTGVTVLADADVRRGLEQRALRNVRNLVDNLIHEQRKEDRLQRYAIGVFLVGAAAVTAWLVLSNFQNDPGKIVQFPKPGVSSQQQSK